MIMAMGTSLTRATMVTMVTIVPRTPSVPASTARGIAASTDMARTEDALATVAIAAVNCGEYSPSIITSSIYYIGVIPLFLCLFHLNILYNRGVYS
jgi:hypothetical protein